MQTLTIKLLQDEDGAVHSRVPELAEDGVEVSDELAVLGAAVLVFLNDTRVLQHYMKIAENELERQGTIEGESNEQE